MKRYTRIFLLPLIIALLFTVTACGKASESPGEGEEYADRPASVPLYPAQVSYVGDNKWGYIDVNGEFALKPIYSDAGEFQNNGLAVVKSGDRYGVINSKGKFVIEPRYDYIGNYNDGIAVTNVEDGFVAIDEQGNEIFGPVPFIGIFSDSRAVFYRQYGNGIRYGYIDTAGNIVVEPKYEYANSFSQGFAVARQVDGVYALLDTSGKELKTFKYDYLGDYSDGLLAYREKQDGMYGYINKDGGVVIKPQFTMAMDFEDGVAVVNTSQDPSVNKYGLIDRKGKFIIQPEYNDIQILGEKMLALGLPLNQEYSYVGSKYAVASVDAAILSNFNLYGISDYKEGVASAYNNTETFFVDTSGKKVNSLPSVKGSGTMELLNGIVRVNTDRRLYYTNKAGVIVYKPSECTKLKIGVTVCEVKYKPNRNYLVYYPELSGISNLDVQNDINIKLKNMSVKNGITPDKEIDYSYDGDFDIGYNKKKLLVLELSAYNFPFGAAHGMPFRDYAHINITSGAFFELKDLFKKGSNYVEVLSEIVKQQIKEHGEEMGVWSDSYKGIKADQPFFITEGALNLYFEPYEIAPYAAGFPTFTIPFEEIMGIIKKDGAFWQSFN